MRRLKLQVQVTVDGHVAGPEGQLDWMTFPMDDQVLAFVNELTDSSDTILMGRKMTPGFIKYWETVVNKPKSPEYTFAQKMVALPKVVFSKTLHEIEGKHVRVENGDLVDAVNGMKRQAGKDMIVYGGATFVSSLLQRGLIDELHLFVNPVAIGEGLRIFHDRRSLVLHKSIAYPCGIVVNSYTVN